MAAGNWVPELLDLIGAENLFGRAGLHSPWMEWPDLAAADPDVIICMPCGYDLPRTRVEMRWLTDRPGWEISRAVLLRNWQTSTGLKNQFLKLARTSDCRVASRF